MAKKEKTSDDVYELVGEFVGFVKTQFEKIEGRFDKNEKTLGLMGNGLLMVGKDIKDLKETTENIDKRLRHVEQDVLTIREDVETLGKIAGRDSSTIKLHGRRLVNLERSRF